MGIVINGNHWSNQLHWTTGLAQAPKHGQPLLSAGDATSRLNRHDANTSKSTDGCLGLGFGSVICSWILVEVTMKNWRGLGRVIASWTVRSNTQLANQRDTAKCKMKKAEVKP